MQSVFGPNENEENRKAFPIKWQEMIETIFKNSGKVISII